MDAKRMERALHVLRSDDPMLDVYDDEELFELVHDVEWLLREAACAVAFPHLQGFSLAPQP